ncbi:Electron transfer flavoprotein-ubiquinone oxidoreductase [Mycena sanguinolenta]|uniref:Electron transfer flavoprotein-ubiquinone oxidoreductase n=1 Tax=Mycena sanguinolenta TaxID=230812 RepID=A0A8H7CG68_9AGAR|nr:Electron transfer flavoprotein-ubiquinone oxidoreductase [Mycena sanguinolenta]
MLVLVTGHFPRFFRTDVVPSPPTTESTQPRPAPRGADRARQCRVVRGVAAARVSGVYDYVPDDGSRVVPGNAQDKDASNVGEEGGEEGWKGTKLVINAQNCIHSKLYDAKAPTQDITWTMPKSCGAVQYSEFEFEISPSFPTFLLFSRSLLLCCRMACRVAC